MKKYYCYGGSHGIDFVKKRGLDYNYFYENSLKGIIEHVEKWEFKKKNIKFKFYAYDERLQKDIYMVIADHSGAKEQYCLYFFEENEPKIELLEQKLELKQQIINADELILKSQKQTVDNIIKLLENGSVNLALEVLREW